MDLYYMHIDNKQLSGTSTTAAPWQLGDVSVAYYGVGMRAAWST